MAEYLQEKQILERSPCASSAIPVRAKHISIYFLGLDNHY